MRPHIHTDFVSFAFAGLSAIVMLHLLRFAAAQMAEHDATRPAAKVLGSLVTFNA